MTRLTKTLLAGVVALALSVPLLPATAFAQSFTLEGKTVTFLVGFREGGGTDRLTRLLQNKLSENLPGNPRVIVLNKPGGGSRIASEDFHRNAPNDGTWVMMGSTSGFLPVLLGAKDVNYDPNQWEAVAGFARGATMFGRADQLGIKGDGADPVRDFRGLKRANVLFATETPLSAEMLDMVAMHLLDLNARVIFGVSSKEAEAALQRGETNANTDNTRSYLKDYGDDPEVVPVWTYGVITESGDLVRDPDLPHVPTYPEYYKAVTGDDPSGLGHELQQNLMNAKVMISKAILLPRGTPQHIRQAYIEAVRKTVNDPEVKAKLPREIGSMPINFGDATQRALETGTKMDPRVRRWANKFLQENFDVSLQ